MTVVLDLLLRFATIVLGYAGACLAASGFLNFVTLGWLGFSPTEIGAMAAGSMLVTVPLVALLIAYLCFFPSLVVILTAEYMGRRDWLFYALGGAFVALVFIGVMRLVDSRGEISGEPRFLLLMIGGGMVGGLAYWLVSGHGAGSWRERKPA